MLVLTRRQHQTVVLTLENGDTIRVTVTGIRDAQVRLGFEARENIRISRED